MQQFAKMIQSTCLAATLFLALQKTAAQEPSPVLWLRFNEFQGKTTPDSSSRGLTVLVREGRQVKGVDGSALDFTRTGASAICPEHPALNLRSALTIEAWIRIMPGGTGTFGTVVRKDGAYALRFSGKQLGLLLWSEGSVHYLNSGEREWNPDRWYHVGATFDGKEMRLYVNGEEVAGSPSSLTEPIDISGAPCCVGSVRGNHSLNGYVDEVRIYNCALPGEHFPASTRAGEQALREQTNATVKPTDVGEAAPVFRKPLRDIRMVVDGFLYIDAEDLADYGGWWYDTQFVHLMGSGFLIAGGVGVPVQDAVGTVNIPQPGTYRVWVRSRNWIREYSPGTFQLLLDGKPLPTVLGAAETSAWTWEHAGDVALKGGDVRLVLHDLTGYYGRCDAIILTTDMSYIPPEDKDALCIERARLIGLSLEARVVDTYDVIVVGAGSAGCPAALAAARMGAKTALIQNRPVLGGNASDECGVPLNGAASLHPFARETGIAEEVGRIRARYGLHKYSEPFKMLADAEPNLTVFTNQHVFEAIMENEGTIAGVKAVDTLTGAITAYCAKEFIDCTGDGWLGYFAKADFRLGREAGSEFNEDLAPDHADRITMSGCLMGKALGFRARSVGSPRPFVRPPWAREITELTGFGRAVRRVGGGEWWMEHPGDVDDLWHAEEARDELIKIAFSYWDFVKNRSKLKDEAETYVMDLIPLMDAKRESRRLLGDYILTQNDAQEGRIFPDRISYGGWPLDVHHPEGIFSGNQGSFDCNAHVPIYTIPFRCLYSRNISNLLFAGRCASVTHIALGTIRVQSTLATLGQAAGTAAAMCVEKQITPRILGRDHIQELQQMLVKNDQTIPVVRNEDPLDLAHKAKVTASSTSTYVEFGKVNVQLEDMHALNMDRGMVLAADHLKQLQKIFVYLVSQADVPTQVRLTFAGMPDAEHIDPAGMAGTASATVSPRHSGWVEFSLDTPVATPFLAFWLSPAEGIHWRLMSGAPPGCRRFYGSAANASWTFVKGQYYACFTEPMLAVAAGFAPENVIDGIARRHNDETHMWASETREAFPQWIQLEFPERIDLNSLYLTFDTNLAPKLHGPAYPPECVRDYTVSVRNADGTWLETANVTDNFQRHCIHRFPTVQTDAVRVTVTATNGDRSARIFEIRAYNE